MKRWIVIIATAIVFLSVLIFIMNYSGDPFSDEQIYDTAPDISLQATDGDVDAPVQIVEFGDFLCPSCNVWRLNVYPELYDEYIADGDAVFAYSHALFHGEMSVRAANAVEYVLENEPESYWAFHYGIYDEQANHDHTEPWVSDEFLASLTESVTDLNPEDVIDAVNDNQYVEKLGYNMAQVEDYEVQFTPTIFINNIKIEDPFDIETIREVIDHELGQ